MSNNEFRCNCVEMTRAIKNKIDMEIANMSTVEVVEYLQNKNKRENGKKNRLPLSIFILLFGEVVLFMYPKIF